MLPMQQSDLTLVSIDARDQQGAAEFSTSRVLKHTYSPNLRSTMAQWHARYDARVHQQQGATAALDGVSPMHLLPCTFSPHLKPLLG